ncbi:MAG: beta-galactosidase [bacterium]|nr:beta-galactosidase [bacterium]
MKRVLLFALLLSAALLAGAFLFLFVGDAPEASMITWGANFSQKQASRLGFDFKEVYTALFEDLGAKDLKIAVHWDLLEPEKDAFFFEDLDWMMDEAARRGGRVLLAVGMKTPRWPECHIPSWAVGLAREAQQEEILEMLASVVVRYRGHEALGSWQVENEPLFPFGECPWRDSAFLNTELRLVQSLDSGHPVFTSDSGELSFWWNIARLGDKAAITMYRKAWYTPLERYVDYPLPPVFYWRKALLVDALFGKEVLVGELQAEPWTPGALEEALLEEQEKTMNLARFRENIAFARETGLDTFYLWGAEWWYWMREVQLKEEIWEEAKTLFLQDETF